MAGKERTISILKRGFFTPLPLALVFLAFLIFWPTRQKTLYRLCTFPGTPIPAKCEIGHRISDVFGVGLGGLVGTEGAIIAMVIGFVLGAALALLTTSGRGARADELKHEGG